ncbi:MAG: hypothetical protein ACR2QO_27530 [Acidimicrobiales bacterium]
MHIGVAHHLGWAVLVTANDEFEVVDRRRVELVDQGLPAAPIHHRGGAHEMHEAGDPLDDDGLEELVGEVRARAVALTRSALDDVIDVAGSIHSISLRDWPDDFPNDIATQRQAPYESQADSVMYRQVFAELARAHGWAEHRFDAKTIESQATDIVGERAEEVLHGPRMVLGAPWNKDHRTALAAIIVASR